jgi:hypothetical protein
MELIESLASVVDLSSGNGMRDTDEISGFCPHKKTWWFSKLISIWRDPFKIKENVSEMQLLLFFSTPCGDTLLFLFCIHIDGFCLNHFP